VGRRADTGETTDAQGRPRPLRAAVDRFNRLAQQVTTYPELTILADAHRGWSLDLGYTPRPDQPVSPLAINFTLSLFVRPDLWRRVKRCARCGKWFLDTSKPRRALFCGRGCVNQAWGRAGAARRAAAERVASQGRTRYSRKKVASVKPATSAESTGRLKERLGFRPRVSQV